MVRAGYKRTDIGDFPEDWEIKTLSKIGHFLKGKGISKGEQQSGYIPAVRYGELYTKHGEVILNFHSQISAEVAANSLKIICGDLLFAGSGETKADIGKSSIYSSHDQAFAGGDIVVLRQGDLHPRFLGYASNSEYFKIQKSQRAQGDSVVHIYGRDLAELFLAFPSDEKEQKAIAEALSDVDALIESLEKLIAKKRAIKTAAMQELLTGKTRLPGFGGNWSKKTLGQLGDCIIGLTYSPSQISDQGAIVLRSSNVQHGTFAFKDVVRVKADIPEKLMVIPNDILICVRNGSRALIGKCAMISERMVGMTFGAFMSIYRSDFGQFLFYQFQSNQIQNQINQNLGATINQITNKTMNAFIVDFPEDEEERIAISDILTNMDSEIELFVKQFEKTKAIKQGMMQELLTGRARLV
jgi:type I restriction enzyme S subunit